MLQTVEKEVFLNTFPSALQPEIYSLFEKLSWRRLYNSTESFPVKLGEEILHIPYRIYYDDQFTGALTDKENLVLDCFFTRHHDGYVRERHVRKILLVDSYVVAPFIVQLLGEYVVEILAVIKEGLTPSLINRLVKFKIENPDYFKKTQQRIQSYWNCYYRRTTSKKDYVGFQILLAMEGTEGDSPADL